MYYHICGLKTPPKFLDPYHMVYPQELKERSPLLLPSSLPFSLRLSQLRLEYFGLQLASSGLSRSQDG